MRGRDGKRHNRILLAIVPVLLCVLTVLAVRNGVLSAIALEQSACCKVEEHHHTAECYSGNFLICGRKAHAHDEHCYLLRLKDNNINWLLEEVDKTGDKRLASVINSAVMQAHAHTLGANPTVTVSLRNTGSPEVVAANTALSFSSANIVTLNNAIETYAIEPAVVLNEELETVSTAALADGGISVLSVDQEPVTGTRRINFYIRLDGQIVCVNDGMLTNSNPDYYSYANIVSAYTSVVETALSTSNINRTYYFKYSSSELTDDTNINNLTNASYQNSRVRFGNNNNTRYAILTTRSGSAYTPVDFHTVTLDYSAVSGTNEVQYVEDGQDAALTLSEEYDWYDGNGNAVDASALENITAAITLYARPKGFVVTFETNGGSAVTAQTVKEGGTVVRPSDPSRTGHTFAGWYRDSSLTAAYDFAAVVTADMTLYAAWTPNLYTVTYRNLDDSPYGQTQTYAYGSEFFLAALPDGANSWRDLATANYYAAGERLITEARDYVFRAVTTYTVTLVDTDGNILATTPVAPGDTYTLAAPDGAYVWADEAGNTYSASATFTVNGNMTFTRKGYLTVSYNINWSTSSASAVSIPSGQYTVPTVMGSSTYEHTLTQGATETLCPVSDEEITITFPLPTGSTARPGVAIFEGWQIDGTDIVLQPGDVQTYSDLAIHADDGGVSLTGRWNYTKTYSSTFFIEYDSSGMSDATDSSLWTPVLYVNGYLTATGTSGFNVSINNTADQDGDGDVDNYDVDARLRSMVASGDFSSFPTDAYIFEMLKNYTAGLSVDGIAVSAEDLNEHGYTILWTKLEYVSADGDFHVDGILVRKTGYIYVNKTFSGNAEAIEAVKSGGFAITAVSAESGETVRLTMDNYETYDAATNTYTWKITDVAYGEQWTLTETNDSATVSGVTVAPYAEYTVSDALGSQSRHGEYTGSVTVTGQTYDDTIATDEVLTVGFSNIYPGMDSFILKKADSDTGNALSGASFSLYQNGVPLTFEYADGVYTCTEGGSVTVLDCTGGFLEITINGLDFSRGGITVTEVRTPEGYISLAEEVVLEKNGDEIIVSGGNSTAARMTNGVLVIGNTATTATVTVAKNWGNTTDARDVVVNLMANGNLVTTLFPNLADVSAVVTLNEAGGYTYTWTGLPAYADGSLITWSVQETRIGDERIGSDGSFANWTVVYSDANVVFDSEGNAAVSLTITNTKKAGNALVIYKTDPSGRALTGAQFLLQMLSNNGAVSADFAAQTGTTDSSGLLTFTGLPYGSYVLTELSAPTGYNRTEAIYFTVNANRTITITDDGGGAASVLTSSGLAIRVINRPGVYLPETGGGGTGGFILGGTLLMAAALALLLWRRRREGETGNV